MIGAIILAAGSSRRFGSDKRKSRLPNGDMVLETTIRNVLKVMDSVLVVLRFGDSQFAGELQDLVNDSRVQVYCAPDSAKGMGSSLANAVETVGSWDAAVVFLGDMPFIQTETVDALLTKFDQRDRDTAPIVLPTLDGRRGHPVVFDESYFAEMQKLSGDQGAKQVISKHMDMVVEIPVNDSGVIKDIDRPDDLADN